MHALEVGKPYLPGRASVPEGVQYNFRAGQHELLLCLREPSEREVAAVRTGEAEFALVVHSGVVFLLYRFGHALRWSDAPYSWHRVPTEQRALPRLVSSPENRVLLSVVLVDATRNRVLALRAVPLSPGFGLALHRAILEQAAKPWSAESYDAELHEAYRRWPSSASMLKAAIARCCGCE